MVKIHLKVGDVDVDYEGAEGFLMKQLPSLIAELRPISRVAGVAPNGHRGSESSSNGDPGTLAAFLTARNAKRKQVVKFLGTADWLHRKDKKTCTTSDVIQALKESHQTPLSNASDCLSKNLRKGYCAKDGNGFFVTEEGRAALA